MMAIPAVVRQSGKNWSWNQTKKQKDIKITKNKTAGDFEMTMGPHNSWNNIIWTTLHVPVIKFNNNLSLLCTGDKIGCFTNWSQHNQCKYIISPNHFEPDWWIKGWMFAESCWTCSWVLYIEKELKNDTGEYCTKKAMELKGFNKLHNHFIICCYYATFWKNNTVAVKNAFDGTI